MAKPGDWVGACIEQELREVIAWKHEIKNPPKVKRDPGSRFSDDGSNFRSIIVSLNLETQPNVQISKVLHAKDPVTILVTDGFTQVRARLSEAAVTTLETELGEKIDHTTKGDVFAIKEAAIISTPYGPSDEHVQLSIKGIEYLYHLRKPLGEPKPAEEREEVQKLIEEITSLRHQQYAGLDEGNRSPPHSPAWSRTADIGRDNQTRRDGRKTTAPRSQQAVADHYSSPETRTQQSPNTQLGVATQVPTRRKPAGPSLSKDGLEIADGANLDRPVQAGFAGAKQRPSSSSHQPFAPPDVTGTKLLNLLKRKTDAPQTSSHRPAPPAPKSAQLQQSPPVPSQAQSTQYDAPPREPVRPEVQRINSSPHAPRAQSSPESESPEVTVVPEPVAASSASRSSGRAPASGEPPPRDYSRRKIPRDQQKLLDQPSSWLPSLPGRKFPHPNVPIELLTRWNAQEAAGAQTQAQLQSPQIQASAQIEREPPMVKPASAEASESSSSDPSSEDEEISSSQWPPSEPPSPVQKRPLLPPDSTMGSNMKSSPVQQQKALPPDSSNESNSRPSSSHQAFSAKQPEMIPTKPRAPHPLPKRPDLVVSPNADARGYHKLSPSQRAENSRARSAIEAQRSSPFQDGSPRQRPDSMRNSSMQNSPPVSQVSPQDHLPVRSNFSSQHNSLIALQQRDSLSGTSPTSVVKATQLNVVEDDDGMEMEMSVPRSLERDPALEHRKRRSEHFKNAQRREWIKQTYTPDPSTSKLDFMTIYRVYKSSHPTDATIKPSELSEAIKDVFPALYDSDGEPFAGLKLRTAQETDIAAPSPIVPRSAPTNMDGAHDTPRKAPNADRLTANDSRLAHTVAETPAANRGGGTESSAMAAGQVKSNGGTTSVFAQFAVPKSSASSGEVRSTPGSGRKLPWAASSASGRKGRTTQQVVGRRITSTPTKLKMRDSSPIMLEDSPSTAQPAGLDSDDNGQIVAEERVSIPPPPPPPRAQSKAAPRSKETSSERQPATDGKANGVNGASISAFSEFARAWKNIKPGGAFATTEPATAPGKKRQLNVLAWEL